MAEGYSVPNQKPDRIFSCNSVIFDKKCIFSFLSKSTPRIYNNTKCTFHDLGLKLKPAILIIMVQIQVIVLNSNDGYMIGETQTLLRNLAKETNNGLETATLSVSYLFL